MLFHGLFLSLPPNPPSPCGCLREGRTCKSFFLAIVTVVRVTDTTRRFTHTVKLQKLAVIISLLLLPDHLEVEKQQWLLHQVPQVLANTE